MKKSEKDQQIEKAILEWDGSYYLPDIRKHLIEVGHRMTKKDLEAFIVDRVGNEWDTIRLHINKIEKKTKQS